MGGGGGIGGAIGGVGKAIGGGINQVGKVVGDATGTDKYKVDSIKLDEKAFDPNQEISSVRGQFASRLKDLNKRKTPEMQAAEIAAANTINSAQIDPSQQAEFRNQQMGLASALQAQMAGQGPSLAQSQLQQATDRNIAQAMALAASNRGQTAGQGLRMVAQNAALANQQAAQQSADLRMQEQMAAQQQLAGVLGTGREQDIGIASTQAQLDQQAGLANQAALNEQSMAQAQMQQQASVQNQQAALEAQRLKDALAQFYGGGLQSMAEQDRQAQMAFENLRLQQNLGIQGLKAGAHASSSKAKGDLLGNIGGGLTKLGAG